MNHDLQCLGYGDLGDYNDYAYYVGYEDDTPYAYDNMADEQTIA